MNICMASKNLVKHHYKQKMNFTVTSIWKILRMSITNMQNEFGNFFETKYSTQTDLFESFRN